MGHLMPPRLAASLVGAVGCHIRTGDDRQRPTTYWRGHRLTQIIHASGGGDTGVKGGGVGSYVGSFMPLRLAASLVGVMGCHISAL